MDEPTRIWSKPELIVLVRGGPEEAVLTACKRDGEVGPGPYNNWCVAFDGFCVACGVSAPS
jgi:hypothetical protein